jgi:O-antigen ligase
MTQAFIKRALAILISLTLPLGAWGVIGIAGALVYTLLFPGVILRQLSRLLKIVLPVALIIPLTTVANKLTISTLLSALGVSVFYTLGLAVAIVLAQESVQTLATAFVLGCSFLAVSVFVDYGLQLHAIPSGLFTEGFHNWTASCLVLGAGLSYYFITKPGRRTLGLVTFSLCFLGIILAFSWVGLFGFVALTLIFLLQTSRRLFLVLLGCLLVTLISIKPLIANLVIYQSTLGEVMFGRVRIFSEGLYLASLRPWYGWGFGGIREAFSYFPVGSYYVDDLALAHFHNLPVQLLFETGIPGFTSFCLLISSLFAQQTNALGKATRASIIGFFSAQFFDYSWHSASIMMCVWLVVALGYVAEAKGELDARST